MLNSCFDGYISNIKRFLQNAFKYNNIKYKLIYLTNIIIILGSFQLSILRCFTTQYPSYGPTTLNGTPVITYVIILGSVLLKFKIAYKNEQHILS